ncbi:MAG: SOS response-associated peptidase [Angustibacter sp.]
MCGRYVTKTAPVHLAGQLAVDLDLTQDQWRPRYNLPPTAAAPVVLERWVEGELLRELRLLRWGLVPSWAKDLKIGARMINARCETLFDKPAFRRAASSRRCLVPADGWYEWRAPTEGRAKQPYFLRRADDAPLAFAGLYEWWRDPRGPADAPWVASFSIITTAADPEIATIHHRMPLVLAQSYWADWLNPGLVDRADVEPLLRVGSEVDWLAHPVATRVGNVAFDDPDLLTPLAPPE